MSDSLEEDNQRTLTLDEYLDELEDKTLEADIVLGGDEGKECTYSNGYMNRQAIFSCLTCTPQGDAGICTACSLSCHDGHEIVELWTKRNFRCDCGNSKFGVFFCKLLPNKDVENTGNSYNHNFKGVYCTCARPYPDPDLEEQQEMIQCFICEDWFHLEHLGLEPPEEIPVDDEGEALYEDFVCQTCSASLSFLMLYPQCFLDGVKKDDSDVRAKGKGVIQEEVKSSIGCVQAVSSGNACALGMTLGQSMPAHEKNKPLFLKKDWRDALCQCERCMDFYRQKGVDFLLAKGNSIAEYEEVAKQKRELNLRQQEGAVLKIYDNISHMEKIEIARHLATFRAEMISFLEGHDPSKPVTVAEIQQVFENLEKKGRHHRCEP